MNQILPPTKRPARWGEHRRRVEEALSDPEGRLYRLEADSADAARRDVKKFHAAAYELHRFTSEPAAVVRSSYDMPGPDGRVAYQVSIRRRES